MQRLAMDRVSSILIAATLVLSLGCNKNGPGLVEDVAGDVGGEVDGAGNTIEGVGKDVTNTVDGPPKNNPPADPEVEGEETAEDEPASDEAEPAPEG